MKFLVNWVKSPQQMGEHIVEGDSICLDGGSLVVESVQLDPDKTRVHAIYAPGCWSSCVEVRDELAPKMCKPADSDVYVEHPDNTNLSPLPEEPISFKEVDRNTLDREMADAETP